MVKQWDDSMKRLVRENPQHFVSWVLPRAIYKRAMSVELKNRTRQTDYLSEVILNKEDILVNFEFQKMIIELAAAEKYELLSQAKTIAALVFRDEAEREWLERIFAVYHDIIEESWVYQEYVQKGFEKGMEKGMEKERQQELRRQRQAFLTIVQRRFPGMVDLAKKQIDALDDPDSLQNLIVQISITQTSQEAEQALIASNKNDKKNKN